MVYEFKSLESPWNLMQQKILKYLNINSNYSITDLSKYEQLFKLMKGVYILWLLLFCKFLGYSVIIQYMHTMYHAQFIVGNTSISSNIILKYSVSA